MIQTHVTLLEVGQSQAKLVYFVTFDKKIVFEKEFVLNIGELFSNSIRGLNQVLNLDNIEVNRYDIRFSSN